MDCSLKDAQSNFCNKGITHHEQKHGTRLTREIIVNNTRIITSCSYQRRLQISEAIHIREKAPVINIHTNMNTTIQLFDGLPIGYRPNVVLVQMGH